MNKIPYFIIWGYCDLAAKYSSHWLLTCQLAMSLGRTTESFDGLGSVAV